MNKDQYLISLSEGKSTDFGRVDFSEQSETQQVFSAIWELESEVNGGGFETYFCSATDSISFAPVALKLIEAQACSEIVNQAIATVFESTVPKSQLERSAVFDAINEAAKQKLEHWESKFYEYPDNLSELLFAWVTAHPNEFGEIPDDLEG